MASAPSPPRGQQETPLAPMASATQLDGQGLGRRVGLAAVLLSEPFVMKLMYRHASERLPEACRKRETLPRDHPTFAPLLQLLELGEAARPMFRAQSFGVRAVEENLMRKVLPCVVALHTRVQDAVSRRKRARGGNRDGTENGGGEVESGITEDWKDWYKEFPVIRRVTCTMLCRALVDTCDEAAAMLMPAALVAVKRMPDELWLWSTLGEVLTSNAAGRVKGDGKEMGEAKLLPEVSYRGGLRGGGFRIFLSLAF